MNRRAFKQQCEHLSDKAEDDDECNASREIVRHMENHRPDIHGLMVDLEHLAQDYDQRAGQIRQVQPLSMVADTLETKARVYRASIQTLRHRYRR